MEVLLRDEDVVSMVLEFLHSRNFCETALALERESGILPAADELLPDQLQYLRRLSLDGEWDNVIFYLEPFTELDEFDSRKLNYLILKQKYIEILHTMSRNKSYSPTDKDALEKIVKDMQPYCSKEELHQMQKELFECFSQESGSLAAFRFQCFKDILEILGPIFEIYATSTTGGESAGQWMYEKFPQQQRTRLESVMIDSLFLNECCQYCRDRALKPETNLTYPGLPSLSTKMLESRDCDASSNAALMFWIRSLKYADLFRQRYEIEDVQIKTEAIAKQKFPHSSRDSVDSPRKFSSFTSPIKTQKQPKTKPVQPSVARSIQLPPTGRSNSSSNQLASSGPAHYPQHSIRNLSNNNNNNDDNGTQPSPRSITIVQNDDAAEFSSEQPLVKVEHDENTHQIKPEHPEKGKERGPTIIPGLYEEKPLKDSSNLPAHKVKNEVKVDDSYETFLEEKKQQQAEKEQFLKNLAEKEKKSEEIRKLLLQEPTEEPAPVAVPQVPVPMAKGHPSPDRKDGQRVDAAKNSDRMTKPFTKVKYVPIEYTEDVQAIRAVAFHPSGQLYAVGSNSKTLRICKVPREVTSSHPGDSGDARASQEIKVSSVVAKKTNIHNGSVYCVTWNDEGSLVATGSNDKLVKLLGFDILGKTLEETPQQMSLHRGIVRDVTFLYESNHLLASAGADRMVCVADCKYTKSVHNLAGHTDQVLSVYSWHPGMLASASQDKSVRLWDVRTPSCVSIIGVGGQDPCFATSVCVDNSGRWLAMGLDDTKVAIYDLKAGKMALDYKCHFNEVRSVSFNPVVENLLLSSSYDGTIVLSDVDGLMNEIDPRSSNQYHWTKVVGCANKLIQCKWHPNGEAFASTSVDKTCKLWLKVNS